MSAQAAWDFITERYGDGRFFTPTDRHRIEVGILVSAGAQLADFERAWDAWGNARRVYEDWGFIRSVVFDRIADRAEMRTQDE